MYLSLVLVFNFILLTTAQKFGEFRTQFTCHLKLFVKTSLPRCIGLTFSAHPYSEFTFTSLSSCIWTMRLCHGNNYTDRFTFSATGDYARSETATVTRSRIIFGSTPFTFTLTASTASAGPPGGSPSSGQSVFYGMYQVHTNNCTEFYITAARVDGRLFIALTGQSGEPLEVCNPTVY